MKENLAIAWIVSMVVTSLILFFVLALNCFGWVGVFGAGMLVTGFCITIWAIEVLSE